MANSAAPTTLQRYAALKQFLLDNGVANVRMLWLSNSDEGLEKNQYPAAGFLPEPENITSNHGGFDTEGRVKIAVWFWPDGSGPYSDTFGGWDNVFQFRDDITSGSKSFAEWFPTKAGLGYGSGQFIATLEGFELVSLTGTDDSPIGAILTVKWNFSEGPAQGQSAINMAED